MIGILFKSIKICWVWIWNGT